MTSKERISLNLRYLREKSGRPKSWVANALGKTDTSIGKYESGAQTPPSDTLDQYADLFGVYVGDIVGQDMWKGETRPPDEVGVVKELERAIREKVLLHDTVEETERQLTRLRLVVRDLMRRSTSDANANITSGDLEVLLRILEE